LLLSGLLAGGLGSPQSKKKMDSYLDDKVTADRVEKFPASLEQMFSDFMRPARMVSLYISGRSQRWI